MTANTNHPCTGDTTCRVCYPQYEVEPRVSDPLTELRYWEGMALEGSVMRDVTRVAIAQIERLQETVQRYVEHHEHCEITQYHGVREISELKRFQALLKAQEKTP